MEPENKAKTLLQVIATWLNQSFAEKPITVELLKEFNEKSIETILISYINIKTIEDVVNLIEENNRWDVLPFILEQDPKFIQNLNNNHKLELIKQLKKKPLYSFDIFYTVIRWGDVELLNLLIKKEKFNDYEDNVDNAIVLDNLLSDSLNKLLLRNVHISEEIKFRCEEILYVIRFFVKKSTNKYINKQQTICMEDQFYNQHEIASNHLNLVNSRLFEGKLSPLHLACLLGRYEMAKLLLESGAEIEARDAKCNSPLHLSAIMGYLDILNLLIQHKAEINSFGFEDKTALHFGAENGYENIVHELLYQTKTIKVNAEDLKGQSALHLAARGGYNNIIKMLLQHKANINLKDVDGNTPAHLAAIHNRDKSTLELLIETKSIQEKNYNGDTLLHLIKNCEIAELLPIKEFVNSKNILNQTPLHSAVINNNIEMVKMLTENGADIYAQDDQMKSPIDYTKENSNIEKHFKSLKIELIKIESAHKKLTNKHEVKNKRTNVIKISCKNDGIKQSNNMESMKQMISNETDLHSNTGIDTTHTEDNSHPQENSLLHKLSRWLKINVSTKSITKKMLNEFCKESQIPILLDCHIETFQNIIHLIEEQQLINVKDPNIFEIVIRWGNVDLLKLLIKETKLNDHEIDKLISDSLNLLILKKIDIEDNIKEYCEEILFYIRLIDKNSKEIDTNKNEINDRIDFVIKLINECDYKNYTMFLLTIRTIAENLFVLMNYKKNNDNHYLCLNQMQFLLAIYLNKLEGRYKLSLSFNANNIINYLKLFEILLMSIKNNEDPLSIKHELLTKFKEDVILNRSLWALTRIAEVMKIIDTDEKDVLVIRYAIDRCAQVTGENLKNTPMSPNISKEIVEVFNKLAPNFLQHIIAIRDSLCHSDKLQNRIQINDEYYLNLKNELKNIYPKLLNIIYMQRYQQFEEQCIKNNMLKLKKQNIQYLDDYLNLELLNACSIPGSNQLDKEKLWYHFCKNIKKSNEKIMLALLNQVIDNIYNINTIENILISNSTETGNRLTDLVMILSKNKEIKLHDFHEKLINTINLKELKENELATDIEHVIRDICSKNKKLDVTKFDELIKTKSNDEMDKKLNFNNFCSNMHKIIFKDKAKEDCIVKEFNCFLNNVYGKKEFAFLRKTVSNWLNPKMDLLKKVRDDLKHLLEKNQNSKLNQTALEKCLLDVLELYKFKLSHNNNAPFDYNYPILLAKELRNHLAHHNILFERCSINKSIILTAKKLTGEFTLENNWKLGLIKTTTINDLETNYEVAKNLIEKQSKLFNIAQRGTLEDFQKIASELGDVASNQDILNSAVIGDNLEIFKYLLKLTKFNFKPFAIKNNSIKILDFLIDLNGLKGNELHLAILYDKPNIVLKLLTLVNSKLFQDGLTPLHLSCLLGKYEMVKILINSGAELETRDNKYNSPLHLAAIMGYLDILNLLLINKAEITSFGLQDKTALHFASGNGHEDVVIELLSQQNSIDINCKDINGETALHLATRAGYNNILLLLLEHDAVINLEDANGNLTVHIATSFETLEILIKSKLKLLSIKEFVNYKNYNNRTSLHSAVLMDNLEMVQLLIKNGADIYAVDNQNRYPMDYAKRNSKIQQYFITIEINKSKKKTIHERLINKFEGNLLKNDLTQKSVINFLQRNCCVDIAKSLSKINVFCNTLTIDEKLQRAAYKGDIDHMIKLVKDGAYLYTKFEETLNLLDVAAMNRKLHVLSNDWIKELPSECALMICVSKNYLEGIQTLLDNGVDVNTIYGDEEFTALHIASGRSNIEAMELLIQRRANVDAVTKFKIAALHIVSACGNQDAITLLLNNKANINAVDEYGLTPLHIAAYHGYENTVNLLLAGGGNINAVNCYQNKPIHLAVETDKEVVIEILVKTGVNVNETDADGKTVLHYAARCGSNKAITKLLKLEANINAMDKDGLFPLDEAVANDSQETIALLLENGAKHKR